MNKIQELEEKLKRLEAQLDEMEMIYGDNFPEPSAQLDQWNLIYDESWQVLNLLTVLKAKAKGY